ncbi:MAG TPA: MarR family transcriptional regulator [Casimicrobiaceae bacterium]|nr:MarR family transcriptional regulator [Casimicrobiaceae bacterium]
MSAGRAGTAVRARRDGAGETDAILRHWIEAVPHDRLAHLVRDAARTFNRALQSRLAEHGVSFGHWTFLRVLWEHDGLTQRQLSDEAGVMEPTTYAAVKAMEQLGYVRRRQRAGNRKNVHVTLTPRGRALKRKLVPLAEAVNRIGVAGVAPEDVAVTRAVLLAILRNLARDAGGLAATPGTPQRTSGASRAAARTSSRSSSAA